MCYISLERVKLCRHSCMIFARLLNAKMKIHVFENYMVIYTGRNKWTKIRVTLEKSKERIAKFADCWVKAHQKLSLNSPYLKNNNFETCAPRMFKLHVFGSLPTTKKC